MNIYVLNALNILPHTNETLEKKLEIFNVTYSKNINMEQYIKYLNDLNKFASKYQLTSEDEMAYYYNLTDAIYAAQHNLADVNDGGCYNCITIRSLPVGKMYSYCYPRELYVYKFINKENGYQEVKDDDDWFKLLANHYMYHPIKKNIELNLNKNEEIATKDFVSELKQNFEKKDYGKMKELLDTKETQVSDKISGFLNDISDSFSHVDEGLNKLFDIFNGKI